jgi:hypothetical protein
MSSLHDISGQILSSGKWYVLFGQVTHNNETILKNLYIFLLGRPPNTKRPPWKSFFFHPGKSSITVRPFWKIFAFFTWVGHPLQWDHFEKSLYFSPKQVAHYNRPLWKPFIFHLGRSLITMKSLWKIFVFFMRAVTHYNETTLKNICIFPPQQVAHYNEIILEYLCIFSPW